MRRIVKGERRQITMAVEQRDALVPLDVDSATVKTFDTRGEVHGLIEDTTAVVLPENRVSFLFDSTRADYDRGKTYFVRFFVVLDNSPKIIAGTVEVRVV